MTISSIIALLVVIALLIPAILYIRKHGTCAGCPDAGACHGHCTSKHLEESPDFEEKSVKIDEILNKHHMTR